MLLRERPTAEPEDTGGVLGTASRRLLARRGVVGVLAGALLMLLVASVLAASGADLEVLGFSGAPGPSSSPSAAGTGTADDGDTAAPLPTAAGTCLTWRADDASDVRAVGCTQSHLFEIVGPVTAPQPPGTPFPADAAWQQLVTDQCSPLARTYLGGKLDPVGRYRAGALKPTQSSWEGGDRTVRCGLQAPGRSGALLSSTGKVADADQAVVFAAGTCLGLDGKDVSDPVSCASRHAAEVAGSVDLGTKFPDKLPSVDDQDAFLQPECTKVAQDHVGGAQKLTDSKLTVYWTNIGQESWDAGTRRVSCNMGSLLADNSGFAPLVGKAADGVTIGGDGPAQAAPLPRSGAPLQDPGTDAAPAQTAPAAPGAAGDVPATTQAPSSSVPAAPSLPLPLPGPLGGNTGN